MYCYCNNNPISGYDPTGHFVITAVIIGAIIGATIGFGVAAYIDYNDDGEIFNNSVKWYDYLGATVLGVVGAGIGYFTPQIGGALSSFASTSFTLGGGLTYTATGEAIISTGLTITSAQILQGGVSILSGIIIMATSWKSGGYRVTKYPIDHDPTHVHIFGDDIANKKRWY